MDALQYHWYSDNGVTTGARNNNRNVHHAHTVVTLTLSGRLLLRALFCRHHAVPSNANTKTDAAKRLQGIWEENSCWPSFHSWSLEPAPYTYLACMHNKQDQQWRWRGSTSNTKKVSHLYGTHKPVRGLAGCAGRKEAHNHPGGLIELSPPPHLKMLLKSFSLRPSALILYMHTQQHTRANSTHTHCS